MARQAPNRIGTAGWQVPSAHRGLVGAEGSVLQRYAARFDCVEVNTSFYRPHRAQTWEGWAAQVPARFRFSAKLPRDISHEARLQRCGPLLDRFRDEVSGLGRKLGGLLLQLPPSLAFDARVAETFLAMLRRRFDCDARGTPEDIVGTTIYPPASEPRVSTLPAERRSPQLEAAESCQKLEALRLDQSIGAAS